MPESLFDPDTGKERHPGDLKTVRFGRVVHGGYSLNTGQYESGLKSDRDNLKRKSEEESERMGFDVSYAYADPSDRKHLGVSDDI